MDNHCLRAIILKLQDRLSNDDRKRLHFYLGNDVPRRIRDDPTLSGTLSLMDSLFDQDKVNEKDFSFLINAFDEIQCIDAVKLLREYWRHNQSDVQNQSVDSLSMIMPPMINQPFEDQDEDKYSMQQQPKFNKWKQNAIIVAGGNERGEQLNQLDRPYGMFIDKMKNIFIADHDNHRIVEWKFNAKEGKVIAGGHGVGNRMDQLNNPTDVIVDQQNHSIIIADYNNRRVIRWLNQTQEILIDDIHCWGLAMDKYGFLYVSNRDKNEVRRWKMGEYNNEGFVVAGGNGEGHRLNQLNPPTFIFIDEDQSAYVSESNNNRVTKWRKDAKKGKVVAGGNDQGRNLNQLSYPRGVIVDDLGQIYVADSRNNRIMRWCERREEGEIVVGVNGQGSQSNQLNGARGLSFDNEGNLYVVGSSNHRIEKFEIIL
ncbi:unnamed protein product [Adineta steineri]|uniref:DED domain-containing protein n=1 Tax=Adineta steineri TaxID=433720 RepID=A0A815IAP5_9BILA|nr:unnamed protein product [Adineta steineri]CAF1363175.1 unnamed protein product [Adineta steineri]